MLSLGNKELPNDICPFSWVVNHREAGCLANLFGFSRVEVTEPKPCVRSKCKLWDRASDDCVFMVMGKAFSSYSQSKGK